MTKSATKLRLVNGSVSDEIKSEGHRTNLHGIESWLKLHRVIPSDSELLSYSDMSRWRKAGAETAFASGIAIFEDGFHIGRQAFVTKSIAALFPELKFRNWVERRNHLQLIGVPVAEWFDVKSVGYEIIEPFYRFGEESLLGLGLTAQLRAMAEALDRAGYATQRFTSAVRSDGRRAFFDDFGSDLGEPDSTPSTNAVDCLRDFERGLLRNQSTRI